MNIGRDEPVGLTKLALALLDRPTYEVIAARRRAGDLGERRDILSLLLQARDRGRRGADRPRAARRAADAGARRPRDDGQLAGLDVGAPLPHPGRPRAAARRRCAAATRPRTSRGDHHRGDALAPGDPDDRPARQRAVAPGGVRRPADTPVPMSILLLHHREDLYPDRSRSGPSAGTAPSRAPTSGSRSAAASGAASARRWRWPSSASCWAMARRLDLEADDPEPERAVTAT